MRAEEIARTHHERWDGRGYPAGLRGEDIPLAGRLTAVADVFDGLTHERPYRAAKPFDEAVTEILRLSGSAFDPRVVAAFEELDHARLLAPVGLP
jgi:putative two-component system response regulator